MNARRLAAQQYSHVGTDLALNLGATHPRVRTVAVCAVAWHAFAAKPTINNPMIAKYQGPAAWEPPV